jgi:hypothetical protein
MGPKQSITERLAGSIQLDDQKQIDEMWQSQNSGKGDYSKERSHVCDLSIDEIFQGIEKMKKEKTGGCQDDR